jgi:hypothetical protein
MHVIPYVMTRYSLYGKRGVMVRPYSPPAPTLAPSAEAARNVPLYMQLEQKKQVKEQEYLDTGKAMRAPMRGLEPEDVEYFRLLQETNQHRESSQKSQVSTPRACAPCVLAM